MARLFASSWLLQRGKAAEEVDRCREDRGSLPWSLGSTRLTSDLRHTTLPLTSWNGTSGWAAVPYSSSLTSHRLRSLSASHTQHWVRYRAIFSPRRCMTGSSISCGHRGPSRQYLDSAYVQRRGLRG